MCNLFANIFAAICTIFATCVAGICDIFDTQLPIHHVRMRYLWLALLLATHGSLIELARNCLRLRCEKMACVAIVLLRGRRSCGCQCGVLLRHIYSGWGCVSDVVRCSCGILLRDICSGWCCISDVVRCSCGILKNSTSTSHIAGNATPPRTNVTKKNSTLTVTNVTFTTRTTTTTTTRPPQNKCDK